MSNKLLIVFSFLLCTNSQLLFGKILYSLQDLQVLASEKNYEEFFQHARDISPAKRSKSWKDMVEQMGQDFLRDQLKLKQVAPETYALARKLSDWPIFRSNEFFIAKRDKLLLNEIRTCDFKQTPKNCKHMLEKVFYDYNHSPLFGWDLLNAIYDKNLPTEFTWNLMSKFVKSELSEFYCHKEPLNSFLDQVLFQTDLAKDLANIHPSCLKRLAPLFKQKLRKPDFPKKEIAFEALKLTKMLKPVDRSLYTLYKYLNQNNLTSSEVEESLKLLKKLGRSYQSREEVTKEYLSLDPLPGRIFKMDQKNTISRTKILSRYFPEIIDSYALRCLDYLTGKIRFQNGNPTPECHHLFKGAAKHQLLPQSFQNRYQKATYFVQ